MPLLPSLSFTFLELLLDIMVWLLLHVIIIVYEYDVKVFHLIGAGLLAEC